VNLEVRPNEQLAKHSLLSSPGYQLFMLVLCIYALGALGVQAVIRIDPAINVIVDYADYAVCAVFFLDFIFSLWRAENRWRYFVTWGWLDLLSSVPILNAARWGRLARVVRVLRVLRGLRATRVLTTTVLKHRAENGFLAASLAAILLVIFCSIAILQFETSKESNIKTPEDALWWSVSTITTVGYGDHYPVTSEGRLVAAILMFGGVGLFSAFSAFLAAWFIGPKANESELASIRTEIAALREAIEGTANTKKREGKCPD